MPQMPPSSSTTIWSACRMVLTRWATTITVASLVSRLSAARSMRVGLEVEGREAVVEHVDVGLLDERPGDGQPLPLPAGDVGAALGDRLVETLGHGLHELLRLRDLQRVPQFLVGGVRVAVAQVAGHGAREEEGLLRDEPDVLPQIGPVHLPDVDPVDEDAARR